MSETETETRVVQMWALMESWFTPTVLFCFLNLMIGSIFIISNQKSHNNKEQKHQPGEANSPQLIRGPSLLERLSSINFSLHRSEYLNPLQPETPKPDPDSPNQTRNHNPPQLVRVPSLLERVRSFSFSPHSPQNLNWLQPETPKPDPNSPNQTQNQNSTGDLDLDHHVLKSKSELSREAPATAGEEKGNGRDQAASFGEDEGVDAKADDFISRFKQQLKLQRLESFLRYKEMLKRGVTSPRQEF